MSIEDRSLDALKEEGTATVIDGSDNEWRPEQSWLYLDTVGYLNILDRDGSLKANGEKDDATRFEVRIMQWDPHPIVMLQHINTKKVVAIKKESDSATVITKEISPGTFQGFTNLDVVKKDHPDILFQKIPRTKGSELFYLKPCDDTRMVGFNPAGDPIVTTDVTTHKCLFKIFNKG